MCACVSWRIKLGIIETHDSIPYKLLDKGLGLFFYSSLRPLPTPSFLPYSKPQVLIPHSTTGDIFVRACAYLPPHALASFFPLLSFKTSSPHCLIAGSVLLCFSQHEKNTLTVGKKCIQLEQRQLEKEGKLSPPFALSFSLLLYNQNFPLLSLPSTSRFISAFRETNSSSC